MQKIPQKYSEPVEEAPWKKLITWEDTAKTLNVDHRLERETCQGNQGHSIEGRQITFITQITAVCIPTAGSPRDTVGILLQSAVELSMGYISALRCERFVF